VLVRALVAELAVEAFDVRVLIGLSWNERRPYVGGVCPTVEDLTLKFWSVVDGDGSWQSTHLGRPIQYHPYAIVGERSIDFDGDTLPREVVDNVQAAKTSSASEPV